MRVTRSKSPLRTNYILEVITLAEEQTSKYLGVDLQSNLGWEQHIDKITKKANNMLGFLKRNLRNTSCETKTNAYISLVRSNIEYCCTVWNPHRKNLVLKVEMVQRRAARFTTNRYHNTSSVSDMLHNLHWETLETRRQKLQLTMLYKIIHQLVEIDPIPFLTQTKPRPRSPHSTRFLPYSTSTDVMKFSFFPRCIPLWNNLPASVVEAHSLASFKNELSSLTF